MNGMRNSAWFSALLAAVCFCYTRPVMAQETDDLPPMTPPSATIPVAYSESPPAVVDPAGMDAVIDTPPDDSTTDGSAPAPPIALPPDVENSEPADKTIDPTERIEPLEPMTPEADFVATWDELDSWMKAHKKDGGSVRLSAPIVMESGYASYLFLSATTLDLGSYSLTVNGELELFSPYLTIKAKGGPDASLRVSSGGFLGLTVGTVEAGPDGPTLWQDEGGILLADLLPEDAAVHYAAQPVVQAVNHMIVLARPGEDIKEALPDTAAAEVAFQGVLNKNLQMPVTWDTEEEDVAEAIANRWRTNISGSFVDANTFSPLYCTLAFLDQPLTFTEVLAKRNKQYVSVWADFTAPSHSIAVEAEHSFDGEQWVPIKADLEQTEQNSSIELLLCDPDVAEEDDDVWDTVQHPALYLRLHWLDAQRDEDAYSDVVKIYGDTMKVGSDTGGNRGGGTGLGPPTLLPPLQGDVDGEDSTAPSPDKPNPPLKGSSTLPDPSQQPVQKSAIALSPAKAKPIQPMPEDHSPPSAAIEEVPMQPSAGQADTIAGILKLPDMSATDAFLKIKKPVSARLQEPVAVPDFGAQALAEASTDDTATASGASPSKAFPRHAVGILATGGIVALTMTWRSWGKRLARILRARKTHP